MQPGIKLKGFISKGKKIEAKKAPDELKEIPEQQEEFLDTKPSIMTTAVRQMFGKPTLDITKSTVPIVPTKSIIKKEESKLIRPIASQIPKEESQIPKEEKIKSHKTAVDISGLLSEDYNETLNKLGQLIIDEDKGDPYINEIPKAYIPESRRGFSDFIKYEYSDFTLKPISEQEPVAFGDKYPYQKFIREYIRNASPYRGILVYHGLGSGKTCSAIAAMEALFSTANKKIIVMTPFSLRKNFLKEITFCGFHHFKLQNYWVSLDKSNPMNMLFATNVLNISPIHLKTANHIWVPDFDQKSNYNELSSDDQTEIRKQILSILVYDKKTNPTGRIHFINYNGISAERLKEIACNNSNYFDNSVIVIDEIHNLTRLMTGNIESYVSAGKMKGRRKIVVETIGADKWKPSLCSTSRNYKRGYLFYRLMLSATNSKIIGLSGTPLINFPEELGILSNILHGYIPVIEGIIAVAGDEIMKRIEHVLLEFEYSDFVRVEADKGGSGIRFTISLLPEGIRKISNDIGVERIPLGIAVPSRKEVLELVKQLFSSKDYRFSVEPILSAKPLLPFIGEDFSSYFLNESKTSLKNQTVLMKRLSGLISYYKGSRSDLMPKINKDVVVRVPMSLYQQTKYIIERTQEIDKEKSKTKGSEPSQVWADIYEISNSKSSNSYRMGSRQTCNFTFPPDVTRPRPSSKEDIEYETQFDKDIVDSAPDLISGNEEFPEIPEDTDEDEIAVEKEEERIDAQEFEGGGDDSDSDSDTNTNTNTNTNIIDCTNDQKFFENKGTGDCLFESIAQVYYPIDIRSESSEYKNVLKISLLLRKNIAKVYMKANNDEIFRKKYSIPQMITGIKGKNTLKEYAKFIQKSKAWGSDTDLEILARILNVPFKLIEHNPEKDSAKNIVRVIENFGSNYFEDDYYIICNLDERHFVLEKHNNPHKNNIEELFNNVIGGEEEEIAPKSIKETIKLMKDKRQSECKAGLLKGETYKEAIERSKKCLVDFSSDSLRLDNPQGLTIYSPKYAAMLNNIQNTSGSSLVYSQFLDMEGIGIFRLAMDANGYAPIEIMMSSGGIPKFSEITEKSLRKGSLQPRYITFSGAEKEDIRRLALDVFNARFNELPESLSKVLLESGFKDNDNKRGQICRCFCITSAGAEGLSLKNVRAVHIMEPYWNDVRLKQVKGRAIRIGSHLDLPKEDQNVSIFTYISCFGKEAQIAKSGEWKISETLIRDSMSRKEAIEFYLPIPETANSYTYTSDEYLYIISERKKIIINELETLMKSSAIDCELNYAENKDGTFKCLSLKGKIGDFLYHPDLQTDIGESQSMFEITDKKIQKKLRYLTYKGKRYAAELSNDKQSFLIYDAEDLDTVIGSMISKDEKPSLPITFI